MEEREGRIGLQVQDYFIPIALVEEGGLEISQSNRNASVSGVKRIRRYVLARIILMKLAGYKNARG